MRQGEWGEILLEEMDHWPHFDNTRPLATSEVEEIVDNFFNVECYEKDNANKSPNDENGEFNQDKEEDPIMMVSSMMKMFQ